jgi:transcriptional regulator with XRE-family HTH domain
MNACHPLKAYRESQSPPLSQGELAAQLKVARNTVTRWENGKRLPNKVQRAKIAKKLGIGPAELLGAAL